MQEMIGGKITASGIESAGKVVTVGAGFGTAGADWVGWINANGVFLGITVAVLSYLTTTAISIWWRCRMLRIAEKRGLPVSAGDE